MTTKLLIVQAILLCLGLLCCIAAGLLWYQHQKPVDHSFTSGSSDLVLHRDAANELIPRTNEQQFRHYERLPDGSGWHVYAYYSDGRREEYDVDRSGRRK